VLVLDNNQKPDLSNKKPTNETKKNTFLLTFVIVLVILIVAIGVYFGWVWMQKDVVKAKIENAIQICQKAQAQYQSEFGQNDISCAVEKPDLSQVWNWYELQAKTDSIVKNIQNFGDPAKEKYQQRQNAANDSQNKYNDRRSVLQELGYKALSSLESVNKNLPAQDQLNYLQKKTQFFDDQIKSLDPVIDRYELLMQYKLDKFWSRVAAAKKLNVDLPVEANSLIQDFNLKDNLKADTLVVLDTKELTAKTKDLNNRLSLATLAIMRAIYPKAQESKDNANIIDIADLPQNAVNIPILMYHHVDDISKLPVKEQTASRKSLTVSPETFNWEMDLIQSKGFKTVDLNDLDKAIETKDKSFFDGKKVILTFDDGYPEHYTFVFKALQARQMKGVFGIVTASVKDRVDSLALTWDNLKEMQAGGMQLVSHSVSHCSLGSYRFFDGRTLGDGGDYKKCDLSSPKEINYGKVGFEMMPKNQVEFELTESKKTLEEKLGQSSPYIILPFGAYNDQTFDMMWQNGYKLGLGVGNGPNINLNTPFFLNRVTVYGNTKVGEAKGWFEKI